MADSTQVNVRYSNVLLARIDTVAGAGKRSEWILEACRMRVDGEQNYPVVAVAYPQTPPLSKESSAPKVSLHGEGSGANLKQQLEASLDVTPEFPIGKPDLEALVSGIMERTNVLVTESEFNAPYINQPIAAPACGKTWWEDGEQYECLMSKGHKAIKCGQAGMVRNITP